MGSSSMHARRRFIRDAAAGAALLALPAYARFAKANDNAANPMAQGRPSLTAQGAALLRAVHQVVDVPPVFADPHALRIIGAEAEQSMQANVDRYQSRRTLRAYVALRSRYAEDRVAEAVQRGVRQYVLLGAGLDTFAYRNPHAGLRVFEIDHPATQAWKKQRLQQAHIVPPDSMTFVPVDFETQTLAEGLRAAGFDFRAPVSLSMLGVAVYLTKPALMETLKFVATLAPGSEIVFSYSVSAELLTDAQRAARAAAARQVAAIGEPWISYYDPPSLAAEVAALGFSAVSNLEPGDANARYFSGRADGLRISGGSRLMTARV